MSKAFMIAAAASGSGKTLITCGLLRLLKNRKLNPASFKCGPDYIDPMFHRTVLGVESSNMDLFFADEKLAAWLFSENSAPYDISVVEGVMGYYDGMSAASDRASSYHVASALDLPVIMVVNAKGQSLTSLAVLKGMVSFKNDSRIAGVIFNNMSEKVYSSIKEKVKEETGVEPIGYLPRTKGLDIESRHLGLVIPEEVDSLEQKLDKLAALLKETVDIEMILKIAERRNMPPVSAPRFNKLKGHPKVAVARDRAFCFYYKDNIELLKKMGAEIVEFSPLTDEKLPDGSDALILGGGYPELHCRQLEENISMRSSIRQALENGMPCLAECGGFMYLNTAMEDMEGRMHSGVGFIEGKSYRTKSLSRFGYITAYACTDTPFIKKGEGIRGHEFHYFDSENCGDALTAAKPVTGVTWQCMNVKRNVMAGFPHLYYYSNTDVPGRFLKAALEYREHREER